MLDGDLILFSDVVSCRHLGDDGAPMPQGTARIILEGDIPLSDDEEEDEQVLTQQQRHANTPEQQQEPRRQLHPDEDYEHELAAQGPQQQQDDEEDDEPEARMDEEGKSSLLVTPQLTRNLNTTPNTCMQTTCILPAY